MKPIAVTFLVNGRFDGIEAVRANGLAKQLDPSTTRFLYRGHSRWVSAWKWIGALWGNHAQVHYVLNTAMPGALLAVFWRFAFGVPYVLDTGDAIYAMASRSGTKAGWRLPLLWMLERLAERFAATIVVRGTNHRDHLVLQGRKRVVVIRDGCAEQHSATEDAVEALRKSLGLGDRFVVGLMGSLVYSPRLQICYGWDLVESLVDLKDLPVTGLVIGDGPGMKWLVQHATKLGVIDRLVFTGRIPYSAVPTYLRLMDVAMSTQTNNLPGQVRTTGKVPEYMAAERFILASKVGEAALLLPDLMLIDFNGEVDRSYPKRLAERIRLLQSKPALLEARHGTTSLAAQECNYSHLSSRLVWVIEEILKAKKPK
jgi:glycosyltransferase involved in cell wall biosynthesis